MRTACALCSSHCCAVCLKLLGLKEEDKLRPSPSLEEMVKNCKKGAKAKAEATSSIKSHFGKQRISSKSSPTHGKSVGKKEVPAVADDVCKGHQSNFLSYMASACKAKDETVQKKALTVLEEYRKMDQNQKRSMVSNFFKSGGKRSGLSQVYSQTISHEASAASGEWRGYITFGKMLALKAVCILVLQSSSL